MTPSLSMPTKESELIQPPKANLEATVYAQREAEFVTTGILLEWIEDDLMPIEIRDLNLIENKLEGAIKAGLPKDYQNWACLSLGIFFGLLASLGPLHYQIDVPVWLSVLSAAAIIVSFLLFFVFWKFSKTIKEIRSDKISEALEQIRHHKQKYKKRAR